MLNIRPITLGTTGDRSAVHVTSWRRSLGDLDDFDIQDLVEEINSPKGTGAVVDTGSIR
jgi:hypothetical protein